MVTGLEPGDVDRLLDAIAELTRPSSMRELRFRCVSVLSRLLPVRHVAWGEIDAEAGYIKAIMEPEPSNWPELETAFAANLADHPVITQYLATGDGHAAAISDFVEHDQFQRTALYREFFAPLGSQDQLCAFLDCPMLLVGIAFDRADRGFTARERELVDRIAAPLANAYEAASSYERLQRVFLTTASQHVERDGEGIVLLDRFLRLEYASPNALSILQRWFPDSPDDGLPLVISAWIKDDWNTHRNPPRPEWPLLVHRVHERLEIKRAPGPDGLGTCHTLDEKRKNETSPPLHVTLGLSNRETQILALVASGMTNDGIATALHISTRTVAKHLERILVKLGVPNRTAAAERLRYVEQHNDIE